MLNSTKEAQDRLLGKRWGVFHHYIWNKKEHPDQPEFEDWSATIDRFDTEKLAKTLHEIGAGYYFITLAHGTEYMVTPNPIYEKLCGVQPGVLCPKRDLVSDLYDSLSKYDIDLYIYCNAYTPLFKMLPENIKDVFYPDRELHRHTDSQTHPMPYIPSMEFAKKWASCIEDTAVRYGDKIKGWWFDSCYDFVGYTFETLKPFYDAVKKGNPYALTSFNNGVKESNMKWCPYEEMTCGEFNTFEYVPTSRFVDGAQSHMLIPLGYCDNGNPAGWYRKNSKCTHRELADFMKKVEKANAVLSIDIYVYPDGSLEESQLEIIRGI